MSARDEAAGGVALLPCPFCGGEPTIEPWHGGRPTKVMISCPGVFANSVMGHGQKVTCKVAPRVTGETPKLAAKAWNRRSPSPRDDRDVLIGELAQMVTDLKLLFQTSLLCSTPAIAKEGMVFVHDADDLLAKANVCRHREAKPLPHPSLRERDNG